MDSFLIAGAVAAALLSFGGLFVAAIKALRFFDKIGRLVNHEMTHNGGSSMKDDTKLARVVSEETLDMVKELRNEFVQHVIEANALMLGGERELGAIHARLKALEDSREVEVQPETGS